MPRTKAPKKIEMDLALLKAEQRPGPARSKRPIWAILTAFGNNSVGICFYHPIVKKYVFEASEKALFTSERHREIAKVLDQLNKRK